MASPARKRELAKLVSLTSLLAPLLLLFLATAPSQNQANASLANSARPLVTSSPLATAAASAAAAAALGSLANSDQKSAVSSSSSASSSAAASLSSGSHNATAKTEGKQVAASTAPPVISSITTRVVAPPTLSPPPTLKPHKHSSRHINVTDKLHKFDLFIDPVCEQIAKLTEKQLNKVYQQLKQFSISTNNGLAKCLGEHNFHIDTNQSTSASRDQLSNFCSARNNTSEAFKQFSGCATRAWSSEVDADIDRVLKNRIAHSGDRQAASSAGGAAANQTSGSLSNSERSLIDDIVAHLHEEQVQEIASELANEQQHLAANSSASASAPMSTPTSSKSVTTLRPAIQSTTAPQVAANGPQGHSHQSIGKLISTSTSTSNDLQARQQLNSIQQSSVGQQGGLVAPPAATITSATTTASLQQVANSSASNTTTTLAGQQLHDQLISAAMSPVESLLGAAKVSQLTLPNSSEPTTTILVLEPIGPKTTQTPALILSIEQHQHQQQRQNSSHELATVVPNSSSNLTSAKLADGQQVNHATQTSQQLANMALNPLNASLPAAHQQAINSALNQLIDNPPGGTLNISSSTTSSGLQVAAMDSPPALAATTTTLLPPLPPPSQQPQATLSESTAATAVGAGVAQQQQQQVLGAVSASPTQAPLPQQVAAHQQSASGSGLSAKLEDSLRFVLGASPATQAAEVSAHPVSPANAGLPTVSPVASLLLKSINFATRPPTTLAPPAPLAPLASGQYPAASLTQQATGVAGAIGTGADGGALVAGSTSTTTNYSAVGPSASAVGATTASGPEPPYASAPTSSIATATTTNSVVQLPQQQQPVGANLPTGQANTVAPLFSAPPTTVEPPQAVIPAPPLAVAAAHTAVQTTLAAGNPAATGGALADLATVSSSQPAASLPTNSLTTTNQSPPIGGAATATSTTATTAVAANAGSQPALSVHAAASPVAPKVNVVEPTVIKNVDAALDIIAKQTPNGKISIPSTGTSSNSSTTIVVSSGSPTGALASTGTKLSANSSSATSETVMKLMGEPSKSQKAGQLRVLSVERPASSLVAKIRAVQAKKDDEHELMKLRGQAGGSSSVHDVIVVGEHVDGDDLLLDYDDHSEHHGEQHEHREEREHDHDHHDHHEGEEMKLEHKVSEVKQSTGNTKAQTAQISSSGSSTSGDRGGSSALADQSNHADHEHLLDGLLAGDVIHVDAGEVD